MKEVIPSVRTRLKISEYVAAGYVGGELDTTVQLLAMPAHNLPRVLFMISFDYPD